MQESILPGSRRGTLGLNNQQREQRSDRGRRKDFVHEIYMAQFIGQRVTVLMPGGSENNITGTLVGLDKFAIVLRVPGLPASGTRPASPARDAIVFKSAIDAIVAESKIQD
jgi:hypothetical protein